MIQNLLDGASVAVSGLIITFSSLGLFAVVIYLLGIAFPYKEEKVAAEEVDESEVAAVSQEPAMSDDLPVVIATAISYYRQKAQSNLGSSLETGKSGWWSAKRYHSQQRLGNRMIRSGK